MRSRTAACPIPAIPKPGRAVVQGRAAATGRRAGRGLSDATLERLAHYVDSHLAEGLSLDVLASVACISRAHFARLFRARTGLSVMEFVTARRLERAKRMLAPPNVRIASVAAAVGFFDQSHFTRTFRKCTGLPPGRYARQAVDAAPRRAASG